MRTMSNRKSYPSKFTFGDEIRYCDLHFIVNHIKFDKDGYYYSMDGDCYYAESYCVKAEKDIGTMYSYRVRGTEEIVHSFNPHLEESTEMLVRTTGCDLKGLFKHNER
jgi:hypothetical protein